MTRSQSTVNLGLHRGVASRLFIGLMSGTSVDAIDAALVRIAGQTPALDAQVLHHLEYPWPRGLRQRMMRMLHSSTTSLAEVCELNFVLAAQFARAALAVRKQAHAGRSDIAAIASHGQTVFHRPPRNRRVGSTLQLGDISVIAARTGIRTIGNFRTADMALGGQGAPLASFADQLLFTHPTLARTVQNIGGIGNVTYLAPAPKSAGVIAFDTGPGNVLMDELTVLVTGGKQNFDRDGALAGSGRVRPKLLADLQSHPFFSQRPPKSTGREEFGQPQIQRLSPRWARFSPADVLATASELTAWSIAEAYRNFLPAMPAEAILCGGGADNPDLFSRIERRLQALGCRRVAHIHEFGIPNKAREALCFAILGAAALDHFPGNLPSVTGASRPVVLGAIAEP